MTMEMQHFLHQRHPLKLVHMGGDKGEPAPDNRERTCAGCPDLLSEQVYACDACGFYLHEYCANLPQKTEHPYHPCPLFLRLVPIFDEGAGAGAVGGEPQRMMLSYRCEVCNFDMDAGRGQLQPVPSKEGIRHFSHQHPLMLSDEDADVGLYCWGCWEPISGKSYVCYPCAYYLHETCSNLPRKIRHFFHPCTLSLEIRSSWYCNACTLSCFNNLVYRCGKCNFDLHVECTKFQPICSEDEGILHFSHHHPLRRIYENHPDARHICSGCGQKNTLGEIYACQSCKFYLHETCSKLPREIPHSSHPCPLFLKIQRECSCDVCGKCCSAFFYCCQKCHFRMDVQCAMHPTNSSNLDLHSAILLSTTFKDQEQIQLFSHPHSLKQSWEVADANLHCSGCKQPISGIAFTCHDCGYYLHKTCAKLTLEKKHFFHPCTLLLKFRHNTICDACTNRRSKDYVYRCQECNFNMDLECAMFQAISSEEGGDKIQHWSHIHPLQIFEAQEKNVGKCHLCERTISDQTDYAICEHCSFCIHKSCMAFQQEIQHRCHPCPLSFTGPRHFCCNTCLRMGSRPGSYQCKKCDFNMDVNCVLFSEETVQGDQAKSILHFSHHHPLQLFENPKPGNKNYFYEKEPKCLICKSPAKGLTYGCKQCNFYLHKYCCDILPLTIAMQDGFLVLFRSKNMHHCRKCDGILDFHFREMNPRASYFWCIPCALEEALSIRVSPFPIVTQLYFHPCSLTLKFFSTFTCNACLTCCHTHAYHCNQCHFHVGFKCAQISIKSFNGEEERMQHYCHWHPLQPSQDMEVSTASCNVCGSLCMDSYFCRECNFHIHKSCMDVLSQKIENHYFNFTLVLLTTSSYRCITCQEENNSSLTFQPVGKEFQLCMKCVLWPKNKLNKDDTFTSIHHWHQLAFVSELKKDVGCLLCEGKSSIYMYHCNQCDYYFHKACAELPFKMEHPLHQQHPLTLISSLILPKSSRRCSLCLGDLLINGHHCGVYHCKECGFQLDKKCATSIPSIQYENHPHLLTVVENMHGNEVCQACSNSCTSSNVLNSQKKKSNYVFRCAECNFNLHLSCGPLPCKIKHLCHVHPLILEDFYVEDNYTDEFSCHICEDHRDPRLPVYRCDEGCPMICEMACVISEVIPKLLGDHGNVELRTIYPSVLSKVIPKDEILKVKMDVSSTTIARLINFSIKSLHFLAHMKSTNMANVIGDWRNAMLANCDGEFVKEDEDEDKNMFKFSKEAFVRFSSKLCYAPVTLEIGGLPDFVMQHNLVVRGEGEYWLPQTLVPIYREFFEKFNNHGALFDRHRNYCKSYISYFVFMLCAILYNMRMTKIVDVTSKRTGEWLTLLKLVEEAGLHIGFISDKIKHVWEAHFFVKAKEIVDHKSHKLQEEAIQLAREKEDLLKKLEETKEKIEKNKKEQEDHYNYVRDGMKDLRKGHADTLLIKWKPATSVLNLIELDINNQDHQNAPGVNEET